MLGRVQLVSTIPDSEQPTTEAPLKTCVHGHANSNEALFCSTCGTALAPPSSVPTAPAASVPPATDEEPAIEAARPEGANKLKNWRVGAIVGAVGALLIGVLAVTAGGTDKITVRGSYMLFDIDGVTGDIENCEGDGGYSDFSGGQSIKVTDGSGDVIGAGTTRNLSTEEDRELFVAVFDKGTGDDGDESSESPDDDASDADSVDAVLEALEGSVCPLVFDVQVERSEFYEFQIGGGNRGNLSYSHDELAERDFVVNATLGD